MVKDNIVEREVEYYKENNNKVRPKKEKWLWDSRGKRKKRVKNRNREFPQKNKEWEKQNLKNKKRKEEAK